MVKSILSHSQQATPSSPESDVPRDAHDGAAGVSGTSCAQEPSHARGCSASSLRRSTEKKKFVGRSPAKLKINRWVCQQYAQLFELQRCSEWVFVLEAETCSTIESLLEHKCDTGRVVVANPNDSVRSAIHSEFPDVNLFPMTSHDFFSAMRESGNSCRSALSQRGWNGCFGMIWLDYCGTFSSIAGRKRQKDIQNIFESGLLCNGSYAGILMLTLSLRGSPQIYEHDVVDSVVAFVTQVAERNAIKVTQNGTCCYKVSCRMYTLSFYARKKEDNDRRTAVEERDSNQRLYLRPENDSQISFFPGTWELLATRDKPLPAGIAMHCTSKLVFKLLMTALQGPMHCCIQESKLFYVSMELCQEDSFKTLLLLVGDPLDQNLAERLISSLSLQVRDRVCLRGEDFREIVCRAADQPEEFADLHKNPFDFVWLGYESYKSFSARDLQHCYTWKDINDLFNHGILSCFHGHECLVGICVNHASNGECWQGSCIDWIVLGFQQVANKYGCEATTLAVVQYCVECPRACCMFLVGKRKDVVGNFSCWQGEKAKVGRVEEESRQEGNIRCNHSCQDDYQSLEHFVDSIRETQVSNWKIQLGWDLDREKVPVKSSFKYKKISLSIARLVSDISHQRHGSNLSVLLHEPGFSFILSSLLSLPAKETDVASLEVNCVTSDNLQAQQAKKLSRHVYVRTDHDDSLEFLESMLLHDVLILCEESGFAWWSKLWETLVLAWIEGKSKTSGLYGLVLLAEASCKQASTDLEQRLLRKATDVDLDMQRGPSEFFCHESCNFYFASYTMIAA